MIETEGHIKVTYLVQESHSRINVRICVNTQWFPTKRLRFDSVCGPGKVLVVMCSLTQKRYGRYRRERIYGVHGHGGSEQGEDADPGPHSADVSDNYKRPKTQHLQPSWVHSYPLLSLYNKETSL